MTEREVARALLQVHADLEQLLAEQPPWASRDHALWLRDIRTAKREAARGRIEIVPEERAVASALPEGGLGWVAARALVAPAVPATSARARGSYVSTRPRD